MFNIRPLLLNILDEGAGDGGGGADVSSQNAEQSQQTQGNEQASSTPESSNNAVLDDSASPSQQVYTAEQFLTNFEGDDLQRAKNYVANYTDKNGNLSIDKMIKSGFNLEGKFGSFTGAPDSYDIKTPDYLDQDVDSSDPYIKEFMETAKAGNMNQEMFEKLMDIHLRASIAPPVDVEMMAKEIGPNFDAMRANMAGFYKNKLDAEQFKALNSMITSTDAFNTLYAVFQASRPTKIEDKVRENFNQGELKNQMEAEYLATDEYGNRKMQDPTYAKAWRERWEPFMDE